MWPILENVPWVLEKNVFCCCQKECSRNVCEVHLVAALFTSAVSVLDDRSVVKSEALKSQATIVLLFIIALSATRFCFIHICMCSDVGHLNIYNFYISLID